MTKKKIGLVFRVWHWFTYHPWLKIISLALAVLTWFYVQGEISLFD